jgi:hypothetical protein
MVYADGSNPSVRKDIGVRLPFPALDPFSCGPNSTSGDFRPLTPRSEGRKSTSVDFGQDALRAKCRSQAAGVRIGRSRQPRSARA